VIQETQWDYRFHTKHLKLSKSLINPPGDEVPLDVEAIKKCLLEMKSGGLGWDSSKPITSLTAVTWGEPPYYQRFINKIKEIPPVYECRNFDSWVILYGGMAKRFGAWNGEYKISPIEAEYRLDSALINAYK